MKRVIDWLNAPDGRFGSDAIKGRDALLARSLAEAVDELTKKLGPDMTAWRWGQPGYHHALIRHPLAEIAAPDVRTKLNVGPALDAFSIATDRPDLVSCKWCIRSISTAHAWGQISSPINCFSNGWKRGLFYAPACARRC